MEPNKAKYSPFGFYVRKLRLESGFLLKDMADHVGLSSSWLSNIETGRKSVPKDLVSKTAKFFNLSVAQVSELTDAASKSSESYTLRGISNDRRDVAAALARNFNDLEEGQLNKLRVLLSKDAK